MSRSEETSVRGETPEMFGDARLATEADAV
jgi:hypothetical protein